RIRQIPPRLVLWHFVAPKEPANARRMPGNDKTKFTVDNRSLQNSVHFPLPMPAHLPGERQRAGRSSTAVASSLPRSRRLRLCQSSQARAGEFRLAAFWSKTQVHSSEPPDAHKIALRTTGA